MSLLLASSTGQADTLAAAATVEASVGAARRFAFVTLSGQAGVSTVAQWTLRALAGGRAGRVLAVDARPGQAGARLAAAGGAAPAAALDRLPVAMRSVVGYGGGVFALGLSGPEPAVWDELVAPVTRHFDVVGTDWGVAANEQAAVRAARSGQAVCLVAPFERDAAERVVALARALHADPAAPRPVLAFVDVSRTRSTWPALVGPRLPFPTIVFGHDPRLAQRKPAGPGTRRAGLLTAAALMDVLDAPGGVR